MADVMSKTAMERIWGAVDRLLPPEVAAGAPEARQTGRLIITFSLLLAANGPVYSVLFWALGAPDLAFYVFVATVIVATVPLSYRRFVSAELSANQAMLGLWGVLAAVGLYTGGVESPATLWYTLMPAFSMLLSGPRLAITWTLVAAISSCGLVVAAMVGVPFESVLSASYQRMYWLATPATIIPLHLGLVTVFYAARRKMLMEVEHAQQALAVAHRHSTTVLDTVDEGLLLLDGDGQLLAAPSQAAVGWFGEPQAGESAWDWLERRDPDAATRLLLGWESLGEAFMPLELLLEQLQVDILHAGREYTTRTKIIDLAADESWHSALLVIKDVTEERAARRADAANRELIALLTHLGRDRDGLMGFFDDLDGLVKTAMDPDLGAEEAFRTIHTIKGNAGLFGVNSLVGHCHHLESRLGDERRGLDEAERQALAERHRELVARVTPILDRRGVRAIPDEELRSLALAISEGADHTYLASIVKLWRWQSIEKHFVRLSRQAAALAKRLGKGELQVHIEHGDVFEAPGSFAPFWSSVAHVIRNAIDHGFESPEQRQRLGKAAPKLTLSAVVQDGQLHISVADDGRGIDWTQIRTQAAQAGLPHTTRSDLQDALFADSLSTASVVSEVSGRGVGMAAVKAAVLGLGGQVDIDSEAGTGTTLHFRFDTTDRCEVLRRGATPQGEQIPTPAAAQP